MSHFADVQREHARIAILRLLNDSAPNGVNDSIMTDAINAHGIHMSRDAINTQLSWLEEQGLIRTETVGSVVVATIRRAGQAVALGRSFVSGIKRPSALD